MRLPIWWCVLTALIAPVAMPDSARAAPCWLPPVAAPVVEGFDAPACPWCAGHRGLEFGPTAGVAVRAVAAGTVAFAGAVAGRRYVSIDQSDGRRVTYGWLATIAVAEGDAVRAGDVVGRAGARLMLTVRVGGQYVDPAPMLGRLVRRPWLIPADGAGREPPPARLECPASATVPSSIG
jgi:murein DD-endopeptidase MepM/ murein hydrolase activator NlpD